MINIFDLVYCVINDILWTSLSFILTLKEKIIRKSNEFDRLEMLNNSQW